MKALQRAFPWIAVCLGLLYVGWILMPPSAPNPNDFDYAGFGAIPVLHNGRVKPMDTVARSYLTSLNHKQTFVEEIDTGKTDGNGKPVVEEKRRPAIRWLLDVMVTLPPWKKEKEFSGPATKHKVFRVESEEVLSLLGLPERPGSWRYSVDDIRPKIGELIKQATRAGKVREDNPKKLTPYDAKVLELAKDFRTFQQIASYEIPHGIPMSGKPHDQWRSLDDAINAGVRYLESDPASMSMVKILYAYDTNDPQTFNRELHSLQDYLKGAYSSETADGGFELVFNRFEPFHQATVLYIFAILLGSLSWLGWSRPLGRAAFWLTVLGFVIHSWAILARMQILGRPPVINLYSSAVFIGWCCVGVCLLMELVYRNCIPLVVGTVLGSVTAGVIAHYLSLDGDTLEMLQAVLDTNLWLATHVTTVTFGYGATLVAGFLGVGYVLFGVFTSLLKKEQATTLSKMIYGVVCFATLLSFTGTVLGGIWADQSWGRFWGWDPKENGALLIVIWNALILHARWSGMIKQRGMALLAIGGNVVTAWSWFGTNLLGVGLHAYGFKSGTKNALIIFALGMLCVICLGLIPQRYWLSFQKTDAPPAPPKRGDGELPPRGHLPRPAVSAS
jgi:ABC-type transport system involved in cytochrome c biogenesis permease subunit